MHITGALSHACISAMLCGCVLWWLGLEASINVCEEHERLTYNNKVDGYFESSAEPEGVGPELCLGVSMQHWHMRGDDAVDLGTV